MVGRTLTVHQGGRVSIDGIFDRLRSETRPERFEARLRRLEERMARQERAGVPTENLGSDIVLGTRTQAVRIALLKVEKLQSIQPGGEGADAPAVILIEVPNSILFTDGSGAQKTQQITQESFLGRQDSDIVPIPALADEWMGRSGSGALQGQAVATSRIIGRESSGDLKDMTAAQVVGVLANQLFHPDRTTFGSVTLMEGASPTLNLVQNTHSVVYVKASATGTITINMPTGSSVRVGKAFLILKTETEPNVTLDAGSGNTIDGISQTKVMPSGTSNNTSGAWLLLVVQSGSTNTWAYFGE